MRTCLIWGVVAVIGVALHLEAISSFVPFVPTSLPQQADGDFDGDGRPDAATIQHDSGSSYVTLRLSATTEGVSGTLLEPVVSLISIDIDHDGDLDLVGLLPSGQLAVWLNNGHGQFILYGAPHPPNVSPVDTFVQLRVDQPMTGPARRHLVSRSALSETTVVSASIRPPPDALAPKLPRFSFPSLRAPPLLRSA